MGGASAFAQLYRFAAAEAVTPERRGQAISFVLAGGLLAGFVGPQLARRTADLLDTRYAASFLCMPLLALASIGLLLGLRLPTPGESHIMGGARPVSAIVRQPLFVTAVISAMASYGVMNLLMTGTPLAMVAHHHYGLGDAAFVIQWHLVGMFLPGFFTGTLIQRIGERATIAAGIAVNGASLGVAALGTTVWHFWLALLLVGVGWNLMFVGGSTLVTRTYAPAERTKAQAANDFLIWTTVAVTSLSSGQLLHRRGWGAILWTAAPVLALAAAGILGVWIGGKRRAGGPPYRRPLAR
jgi:MFS family permease